jgi:alpha-tubulin suppressor-like RCC1 family protein
MAPTSRLQRPVAKRSRYVTGSIAAVVLITLAISACAAGDPPARVDPGRADPPAAGALAERWGSFFGGTKGNFGTALSPVKINLPGTIAQIGTSNSTQYALLTDGSLYAWGLGTQGQFGDGTLRNSFNTPVQVQFPYGVKIKSIPTDVMPYDTALAVDSQGRAWGWGANTGGELCQGNKLSYTRPVRLPFSGVTTLAGASGHALYDANGTVWACGRNTQGDLGDGQWRNTLVPRRIAGLNGAAVTELVASFANSGALLANGNYYDWGYDDQGQLGNGRVAHPSNKPVQVHLREPVTQVAQGGSWWNNGQTLVLLADGSLWSWGNNRAGQLGVGITGRHSSPVRFHSPSGVTFQNLATGSATSYAVSSTGNVYAWGVSHVGQVGDGSKATAKKMVKVASGASAISSTANNVVISIPGS